MRIDLCVQQQAGNTCHEDAYVASTQWLALSALVADNSDAPQLCDQIAPLCLCCDSCHTHLFCSASCPPMIWLSTPSLPNEATGMSMFSIGLALPAIAI